MNKKREYMKNLLLTVLISATICIAPAAKASEGVSVGLAVRNVTPVTGLPLAGYGGRHLSFPDIFGKYPYTFWLRPSLGIHDPIRSKAMVLQMNGTKVLFLSLDVVGATVDFYDDVAKAARLLGIEYVIVTATHTHSGPGGMSRSWFWKIVATDSFVQAARDVFVYGVIRSVQEAVANLTPASLYTSTFVSEHLQHNRRDREGYSDPNVNFLLAKSDQTGKWLGGFVNFAVHGTAMGSSNQFYSADVSGVIERSTSLLLSGNAQDKPIILHINGAEGDISPGIDGWKEMDEYGERFSAQATPALANLKPVANTLKIRTADIKLPKGRLKLKLCKMISFLGNKISIGLSEKAAPTRTHLTLLQLGDITMATWPGEPTTEVGLKLKDIADSFNHTPFWNLGLANGYMGYFVSYGEYQVGGYEACSNYHSPAGSEQIIDTYQTMLENF